MEYEAKNIGYISNWHINEYFLECSATFFPEDYTSTVSGSITKLQNKFQYYANKLVEKGILSKAIKSGIGWGGYSEFGCRTQTIWRFNQEYKG